MNTPCLHQSFRLLRFFSWRSLQGAALGVLSAFAMPLSAQTTGGGTVTGTAINASTQKVLERAVVVVEGTGQSTVTSPDGSFRLWNIPAGSQNLVVSYAGLSEGRVAITVVAGETTSVEVTLRSDVIEMGEFHVAAEAEGNAYAIQ